MGKPRRLPELRRVRPLRHWVRDELRIKPSDARLTGYWKWGVPDYDDD